MQMRQAGMGWLMAMLTTLTMLAMGTRGSPWVQRLRGLAVALLCGLLPHQVLAQSSSVRGDLYVLAVGVTQYAADSNFSTLTYTVNDAKGVVDALLIQKDRFYNNVYPYLLLNEEASAQAVVKAMDEIVKKAGENDTVIALFSAHGVNVKNGDYYLATYGAKTGENGSELPKTALSGKVLLGFYTLLKSKALIMLDACQAGSIFDSKSAGNQNFNRSTDGLIDAAAKGETDKATAIEPGTTTIKSSVRNSKFIISATSGDLLSYEASELKNGLFTYAVIEALNGTGENILRNKEGELTIIGLTGYIAERVPELAKKYAGNNRQTPYYKVDGDVWPLASLRPPGTGRLVVNQPVNVPSKVFINGKEYDKTYKEDVIPGRYTINVIPQGYNGSEYEYIPEKTVDVVINKDTVVNLEVKLTVSQLQLEIEPSDANVSIDGTTYSTNDLRKGIRVFAGPREVKVSSSGFLSYREVIAVVAGQVIKRQLSLEKLLRKPGAGAFIATNGQDNALGIEEAPFLSLARAMREVAPGTAAQGETIRFGNGTFTIPTTNLASGFKIIGSGQTICAVVLPPA
jgi:uncharacterized caspase-like protein